jgi:hypothetical protein
MAKIITVPNDNDPVMNADRQRIAIWSASHGWMYSGYNDESDHIAQIRKTSGGAPLEVLDFNCHGNPSCFDDTTSGTASQFGLNLSQSTGFSANTSIYLDACNTGLTSEYGGPIAQILADAVRCRVYGTKGYMTGTYAEGDEQCYASPNGLAAYPGAEDAVGRNVWIEFRSRAYKEIEAIGSQTFTIGLDAAGRVWGAFQPAALRRTDMIRPQSLTVQSGSRDVTGVAKLLEEVLRSPSVEFPNLRMAPDVTINYISENGVLTLDVYANGSLVRDRVLGTAWRVQRPAEFRALVRQSLV